MLRPIFICHVQEDDLIASLWESKFRLRGYTVLRDTSMFQDGNESNSEIETAIKTSSVVLVLVSPASMRSERITQECSLARHHNRRLLPVLIQFINEIPWYLQNIQIEDATHNVDHAINRVLDILPKPDTGLTLGNARDEYLQRATLKSEHTISSYRRAIELFFEFLSDRSMTNRLPIQNQSRTLPEEILISALTEQDAPIFLHFAQWLLSPPSGRKNDHRPYKPSTVELRLAGLINWFQFIDDYGWLPPQFKLAKATRIVRDELRARPQRSGPPQPPTHVEEVIYYYDALDLPRHLQKPNTSPERIERWELTRQRNRALLHCLAETGGRISEILSLNVADFPVRNLEKNEVLRVEVVGKGGHPYYLRFLDSLPTIRSYIHARGPNLRASRRGEVPLFVSHDTHYEGSRMSRVIAWRVVQRAAHALGLRSITPHDFRHWRATQLINAGHPLDVVQDYLGHRSVETTRAYYAHTDPLRVDDAAKMTGLPDPEDMI